MNAIHLLRHEAGTIAPKLGLVTLMMFLPFASPGGGVVTECTEANLRSAMAGGGTVTFACDGTIPLTRTITNELNTSVDASGHQITISGDNLVRVLYLATNSTLKLINLAIADGSAVRGAGIFNAGGNLILLDTAFFTNIAHHGYDMDDFPYFGSGGGILNLGGTVRATNCIFRNNRAELLIAVDPMIINPAKGGAIFNEGGQVILQQCHFIENLAFGSPGSSPLNGPGSPGNAGLGGAIFNAGELMLNDCHFLQNSARGGLAGTPPGFPPPPVWQMGSTGASGGNADGGAIWNSGVLTIHSCAFADNSAKGGRGGTGGEGEPYADHYGAAGTGGSGGAGRGGVLFNLGSASLANSSFGPGSIAVGGNAGDAAAAVGSGAIYAGSGGAGGLGGSGSGAALVNLGTMRMVNCTVASNVVVGGNGGGGSAGANGIKSGGLGGHGGNGGDGSGAIWSNNGLFLTNCTIAMNFATNGNGGSGGAGGTRTFPEPYQAPPGLAGTNGFAAGGVTGLYITLVNTLLAGNAPVGNWSGGAPIDGGHNLSSDNTCAFTHAGSLNNTNPRLGPLRNNGGPTPTMALLPDSPAINAGDNLAAPSADQRGIPRPFGSASDIGAYEYATLLRITRATDNDLDLALHDGVPGAMCRLLTSTNLTHWQSVATNQILSDGKTVFQDSLNESEAQRFYRAVSP